MANKTVTRQRLRCGADFCTLPATDCKRASQLGEGLFDGGVGGVGDMSSNRATHKTTGSNRRIVVSRNYRGSFAQPRPAQNPIPPARFMKPERFHHQCGLMCTKRGGKAANLYSKWRAGVNVRLSSPTIQPTTHSSAAEMPRLDADSRRTAQEEIAVSPRWRR
ncbi:MAG TPA: hypothetical protein VHY20_09710 [Pirellulales bacterium]|jgi:hypothetical protein|nr:hypothetical protein [Pirellulales bacterium]